MPEDKDKIREEYEIKQFGSLDQQTLEGMLVGYLVFDKAVEDIDKRLSTNKNGELLLDANIKGDNFENKRLGKLFDDLLKYYKSHRQLMTLDDSIQYMLSTGASQDEALAYSELLADCHAAVIARHINLRLLTERFKTHFYVHKADDIYQAFVRDRGKMDPKKAIEKFCQSCRLELVDPDSQAMMEFDLGKDAVDTVEWVVDMKRNPDKYVGIQCGMDKIDKRTTGFKPGQLTIFVGRHGGYKTTTMMNVAYGLLMNTANVLYVSLEMSERLLMGQLLCRHSRKVSWSKMIQGRISEPEDWVIRDLAMQRMGDESLSEKERMEAKKEVAKFNEILSNVEKGQEESLLLNRSREEIESLTNKLKIARVGQSDKIKVSELERWIEERIDVWHPDVVIVDYLAMVASDEHYKDRRDLEVGDICKKFRSMGSKLGFHVISAAQFKRGAIERIRDHGFSNPEKAMLGTDDIAESNQIGADADTVFMLWPEDGGNRLKVFVPKARHAAINVEQSDVLQVDQEHCTISDDIVDTQEISNNIEISAALSIAEALGENKPLAPEIPNGEEEDIQSPFAPAEESMEPDDDEDIF